MANKNYEWVGPFATILSVVALVPQLTRIISRKEANDYSWYSLLLGIIKNVVWIYYGIMMKLYSIIVYFSFKTFYICTIGFIKWKYYEKNEKDDNALVS